MTTKSKGPVEAELEKRITEALSPAALTVTNDSAQHSGHMGDDGSGESHFSVEVVAVAFAGKNRVMRQRLVNQAVGDLLSTGAIHALAIKARAPGE